MSSAENARGACQLRYTPCKAKELKALHRRFGHTIRINRKDYELIYCTGLETDGKDAAGLCCPEDKQIYIQVNAAPVEETLIHEIMHAELWEAGFRQRSDWDEDVEEQIVETAARSISHLYRLTLRRP